MRISLPNRKTRILSASITGVAMFLTLLPAQVPASAASCSYPAQVLDLTNWKQTLPIGSSSSPTEIKQTSLSTYAKEPFFQANATCDGVTFRAPVNGVTTSGSGYPRSELREMTGNGKNLASWSTTSGVHSMFIDQAITAVPKTKKHVVAGQIHDANDDVIVIRLEYPKLFVDINGKTGPTLDANYKLGKRFTVQFVSNNGQIKVYYNGNKTPAYTLNKKGSGHYFKAGAYTQSNCSKESSCSSSNYGEVVIYGLKVQHTDSTSSVPILTSTPASNPTPEPTPSQDTNPAPDTVINNTFFEAEIGSVTEPLAIVSDESASNGKYVVQTADTGTGSVKYTVAIPTDGKYQLWAKAIAPNGSSNSIYYALDSDNASKTWSFPDNVTKWTWIDGPTVTLNKGNHTFLIKKRETNTKIDAFEFRLIETTSPSEAINGTIPFEAESGTMSEGVRMLSNDSSASNNQYVQADSVGSASYQVNIPESGTYAIAGWVKADNGSSDSFYVSLDSKPKFTWALPHPTMDWTYDIDDSHNFSLKAGLHTLTLRYREAGSRIDKLVLVKQ